MTEQPPVMEDWVGLGGKGTLRFLCARPCDSLTYN